ncbi:hypothetical protein [Arthrobacter sp. AFG20]|uniref:hypothetical protein n=1 Tax=Arthrobacter sp. AFG20 TaxID=1688671 RepID=UPI0021553E55|nr:hypothetical protein [Arthrobacter sp. AFG20]
MSTALILKLTIATFATLLIAALAWWARKHPNRSKEYPEQVRMPKAVPFVGWLFLSVGLLMGLFAFASARAPLGARIASVAIVLGGMAFLAMYRNFYVAPRAYEVAFRNVLGKEHVLPYSEISQYRVRVMKGQPYLTVKSIHGVKLSLNIRAYDVTPLLQAIDFHEATGRWPGRAEVSAEDVGKWRPG